jgi:hypothetical protein
LLICQWLFFSPVIEDLYELIAEVDLDTCLENRLGFLEVIVVKEGELTRGGMDLDQICFFRITVA